MRKPAGMVALLLAAALGGLHRLGRTSGSTPAERRVDLPGDDVVVDPDAVCVHATTIDAPPEAVWPWLMQVGWHRAGWYTARWVDRLLFPDNWPSADRLIPELGHLGVGDFIPDGSPESECGFTVLDVRASRHLLLRSTTHLPLSWRRRNIAALEWTWVFVLIPVDSGRRTRFVFRWRASIDPWWCRLLCHAVIVPADAVMSHDMLRGVRRRVEGKAAVPARAAEPRIVA